MKSRYLLLALAFACPQFPALAKAQAFLSDPRIAEGSGIKAGDLELHPGIAGEGGYDSNYFQNSGGTNEPVISVIRLRLTPSLSLQSFGARAQEEGGGPPPSVKFRARMAASYNHLFATDSQYSDQVSDQSHVAGNVGANLDILPQRPWGGDLSADYNRIVEPSNDPDASNAFKRHVVRAGAGITWRPGGGLFNWRLGYGIGATFFDDEGFDSLNNLAHRLETSGRWKFLPRTAILYRGELGWLTYTDGTPDRHDGQTLRTQVGINGLISNYFGFLGLAGWGATFFDTNAVQSRNFDSFIGQAELTWYPMPQPKAPEDGAPVGLSAISLGFNRTFSTSYLGDYYARNRGYGNITYFLAQQFVLSLAGGVSLIERPAAFSAVGQIMAENTETRADMTAFAEYRPGESVGINATFRYDTTLSAETVAGDNLEFSRYQAFLGIRWFL